MKPAIIVVDMLKDNVNSDSHFAIGEEGRKIIPTLQKLLDFARRKKLLIVYANDSFLPNDFCWQGRMKPHAIRGTPGADVIDELKPQAGEIILPKRRFGAFFKTDLDITLREHGVDTIVVGGIATEVCVYITVMEGLANDFRAIVVSDCCASFRTEIRDQILNIMRRTVLYPLMRVMTVDEFMTSLE